jgi:G3E family GTPase
MSVPVVILSGFLGSGKTTLLARSLEKVEQTGCAVIVNELGEVGLDHHLLREVKEEVVVLPGGCVCCSVRNDLLRTLDELHRSAESGQIPPLRRVVLETTGIADPAPLLATLAREARESGRFHLAALVVTVDAVSGAASLDAHPEARLQVALADRVVITKCDDDAAHPERIEARLDALAPGVFRIRSHRGEVPAEALFDAALRDIGGYVDTWLGQAADRRAVHHAEGGNAIHRITVTVERPVLLPSLLLWLSFVSQMDGDRVLRIKALVLADDEPLPLVLQTTQHVVHPVFALSRWPEGPIASRFTVLTRGVDERGQNALRSSLRSLDGPSESRPAPT